MTAHATQIFGLKFGTPGRIERDDEICLQIDVGDENIIHISHGNKQIAQFVLRIDGFVDMVDPEGRWIIPVGICHPITMHFSSPFELSTLFSLASHASMCNANN